MINFTRLQQQLDEILKIHIGFNDTKLETVIDNIAAISSALDLCFNIKNSEPADEGSASSDDDSNCSVFFNDNNFASIADISQFIHENDFAAWIKQILNIINQPESILHELLEYEDNLESERAINAAKVVARDYVTAMLGICETLTKSNGDSINVAEALFTTHFASDNNSINDGDYSKYDLEGYYPSMKNNLCDLRYSNIIITENSRVKLGRDLKEDFIAANLVCNPDKAQTPIVIATQAPMLASRHPRYKTNNTMPAFWRMAWENNVSVLVMLTKLEENNREKADQYWPDVMGEQAGHEYKIPEATLKVILTKTKVILSDAESEQAIMTKRSFVLRYQAEDEPAIERKLTQYHYEGWPDSGVPSNTDDYFLLQRLARKSQADKTAPMIVHCSAGIGRTGVWCAIDCFPVQPVKNDIEMLRQLAANLLMLRRFKHGMVQTREQFKFLAQCYQQLREQPDVRQQHLSHQQENKQASSVLTHSSESLFSHSAKSQVDVIGYENVRIATRRNSV